MIFREEPLFREEKQDDCLQCLSWTCISLEILHILGSMAYWHILYNIEKCFIYRKMGGNCVKNLLEVYLLYSSWSQEYNLSQCKAPPSVNTLHAVCRWKEELNLSFSVSEVAAYAQSDNALNPSQL